MEKYEEDIEAILKIIGTVALFFMVAVIDDPITPIIGAIFWISFWSYNIYDKLQYRNNQDPNEIRFPTQNDTYEKMTSITLGSIISFICLLIIFLKSIFTFVLALILLSGILILINGLIDLPKGRLKIEHFKLKLAGQKAEISLSKAELIEIKEDTLTIKSIDQEQLKKDKLELSENWKERIADFLEPHLSKEKVRIIQH